MNGKVPTSWHLALRPLAAAGMLAAVLTLPAAGGCRAVGIVPDGQTTDVRQDPEGGRAYELHLPSAYDRAKAWPLVVVCSGGWFNSASGQIDTWKPLADSRGFLVAAPKIKGLPGGLKPDPAEWTRVLRENEAHILAAVKHIRAGHNISEDRIFLYGWSDGAMTALFAGARNAALFRAVSAAQPAYEEGMMEDVRGRVDSYQPVQLRYANTDVITGKAGRLCEAWLRANGVDVRVDKSGNLERKLVGPSVDFFERVIMGEPLARIETAAEGGNPLGRKFTLVSADQASRYYWEFGDGDTSPVAQPVHIYPAAGTYRVRVLMELADKSRVERTLDVTVP